ncbi:NAD(P)H-hydrate dehydratase [Candidatus Microgenomates bacterium]|nr:NAD(P)H-hydrate dehydratase [Candidatus Microgenomates bacterium]
MEKFDSKDLKKLYLPIKESHKGQNGKLTIIGGSHLFHGASLWALKVASRICDMVFYASTPENNELTQKLKSDLYDFIAVPREKMEDYIEESDVILIGPGLPREEGRVGNEEPTRELTERLLKRFSEKKWVIDAGSLQTIEPERLKELGGNVIITPHLKEFETLFKIEATESNVSVIAQKYDCTILLKGEVDVVCNSQTCRLIEGGNAGMTKGGTGDVLAGLAAALACKNDLFLAACSASYINKKAGDELYKRVGYYFNASDLADEIPKLMKQLLL